MVAAFGTEQVKGAGIRPPFFIWRGKNDDNTGRSLPGIGRLV